MADMVRATFSGAMDHPTRRPPERRKFFDMPCGTVFLDEIREIDPQAQVKLLRILESGELRRLGETRLRTVDVRIVAATNADLERQLEEGFFRRNLYYRVRGYQIDLPPLPARLGDVLLLAEHFLRQGSRSEAAAVGKDAVVIEGMQL
jgi:transcriptional regulator with GAF, ATPase, and Fis domain